MYYIEQICRANGDVHINVLSDGATKGYFYNKYRKAKPNAPYTEEQPGVGTVYVDARETREEALERAGELAQANNTVYGIDAGIRRELKTTRRWFG